MKRLLTYPFGTLKLFDNYVLAQVNEGASITIDTNNILKDIATNYYKGQPFVYISYRKYSYSVDPAVYLEASKIKNLIGFAIVTDIPMALSNTRIERMFVKKIFETFEIISEAKIWANNLVKQRKHSILREKEMSSRRL
ncbi:conserved hypothetical protein [Formosa agariphila KMM 3901]|uniref:STAS/SEC14 domain-containing protein n=1 Tax=Formosa agariphila (strain DSM 15362 / KCTC 12365 / LMG 23005 / KMM 3901 / M-2Alg 35-1) TaxID=1347342 RepID=T2KNW4_FORAG|nr:hypothetical protein [Formosa agariphila]CDF80141.1 conserved hypothetical protein [Formosa agariphila KMM 3901]